MITLPSKGRVHAGSWLKSWVEKWLRATTEGPPVLSLAEQTVV